MTGAIITASSDAADMRRRMGAAALAADRASDPSAPVQRRAMVAARFSSHVWPMTRLLIVAVDAHTGEPVVFDCDSGVDLVDAITASCAGGFGPFPPHSIGNRRYIDGGYRSVAIADLAAGSGRVLVLAPFGFRSRTPREWGIDLAAQVEELRVRGSRVETIVPDEKSREAFGVDVMAPSTRAPAAGAGYGQGRALAVGLSAFWR